MFLLGNTMISFEPSPDARIALVRRAIHGKINLRSECAGREFY